MAVGGISQTMKLDKASNVSQFDNQNGSLSNEQKLQMCGAKAEGKAAAEVPSRRKFIVGGNWKSNGTVDSMGTLINDTLKNLSYDDKLVEVVVAPIAIHIASAKA